MKKVYIFLFALCLFGSLAAQHPAEIVKKEITVMPTIELDQTYKTELIDTIFTYLFRATRYYSYGIVDGGYVFGNSYFTDSLGNDYQYTVETAVHYDSFPSTIKIIEVVAWVSVASIVDSADDVTARVYLAQSDSMPGIQVGFGNALMSDFSPGSFVGIPINNGTGLVNGDFLVSIDYEQFVDDSISVIADSQSDGLGENRVRQRLGDDFGGTWERLNALWSNPDDVDVMLLPVYDDNPSSITDPISFNGLTFLGTYPNPTNSVSNVSFSLDRTQDIGFKLFDIHGKVHMESNTSMNPGSHKIEVDTQGLAAGSYYYILKAGGRSFNGKIMVVK